MLLALDEMLIELMVQKRMKTDESKMPTRQQTLVAGRLFVSSKQNIYQAWSNRAKYGYGLSSTHSQTSNSTHNIS